MIFHQDDYFKLWVDIPVVMRPVRILLEVLPVNVTMDILWMRFPDPVWILTNVRITPAIQMPTVQTHPDLTPVLARKDIRATECSASVSDRHFFSCAKFSKILKVCNF